ncbi:hypothetical protein OG828_48980 [Streptomyces sp. NBC_00457]|uniref:hypothetical protein n=1 Tax=Streptomyces sp. NBC_00457 TaxID=2975748 RepID=UPI002E1A19E3
MVRTDRIGRLQGGERWRSEHGGDDEEFRHVIRQLESWLHDQTFNLRYQRSLSGGGSGAYVAVVHRTPHRQPRKWDRLIVKLVPPDDAHVETNNVRDAMGSGPEAFRSAHLVELEEPSGRLAGEGSWWIHLQRVVLGDLTLERAPRLVDLVDDEEFDRYCATLVTAIITEWGLGSDPVDEIPSRFLERFLGQRLEDPAVRAFLSEEGIDTVAPAELIRIPGRQTPLPNPFALLKGAKQDWQASVPVFLGSSHGDLHVRNVLLPRTEAGQVEEHAFQLIDLGRYSTTGPLSLDPMRLLLSIAAEWLPSLVPHSAIRSGLAELMVAPGRCAASPPMVGYRTVAKAIHTAAEDGSAQHGDREAWKKQNHLVLVGCALRFFARPGMAHHDRWWFLEVAALATRAFVGGTGTPKEDWTTSPTEACATGRAPLGKGEPKTAVSDRLAEVIPLTPPPPDNQAAAELAALVREIERLPHDASAARLGFMAVSLRRQAEDLADALTDRRATLLRNQLRDAGALLSQFGDASSPGETLRRVQQAGRRLRIYGQRLWPDEVG